MNDSKKKRNELLTKGERTNWKKNMLISKTVNIQKIFLQRLTATKVENGKAESIPLQSMEKNQPSNGVKKTNVLTVQAVNDGVSCVEETGFTQINHMTNNPLIEIETRDLAVVLNAQTEKINVCIQ